TVFTNGGSMTTAADGYFRLANLAAGTHQVTVTASGFTTAVLSAVAPQGADATLPVQLGVPTGTISGFVLAAGTGVAGAVIQGLAGGVIQASTISDVDGSFTLPLAAGTSTVQASAMGFV